MNSRKKGLSIAFREAVILGLLVGCTQSEPNPHDEACAGGFRVHLLTDHSPRTWQSNEAFMDVTHGTHLPFGRSLREEMFGQYRMLSPEVLVDAVTEFIEGPAHPIEADVLTAIETRSLCPDSATRIGSISVRRCGNSIALRPEGSPDPLIGFIDPETGFFSVNDPVVFDYMFGYLYEDRTGYAGFAHRADPECRVTGMLLRPADRACALNGRYEGRFDVVGSLDDERCVSGYLYDTPGVLVVESGQMTIEFSGAIVTGPVDAQCGAELISADGSDRWSLHCDERARCSGTREQADLGCRWIVAGVHPNPPGP